MTQGEFEISGAPRHQTCGVTQAPEWAISVQPKPTSPGNTEMEMLPVGEVVLTFPGTWNNVFFLQDALSELSHPATLKDLTDEGVPRG